MSKRKAAGNWVDRNESLEGKLSRLISRHIDPSSSEEALSIATQLRGLVEADASEVQVADFLKSLLDPNAPRVPDLRLLAVALWHVAKCGLVRDRFMRT